MNHTATLSSVPCNAVVLQITPVRVAAEAAGKALMQSMSEYAIMEVLPTLLEGMELKKLWQTKVSRTFTSLHMQLW